MSRDHLKLLSAEGKSDEEIQKIKIRCDFMDRLPTDAMRDEFIELMKNQSTIEMSHFEERLNDFSQRVQAILFRDCVSPYPVNNTLTRVH